MIDLAKKRAELNDKKLIIQQRIRIIKKKLVDYHVELKELEDKLKEIGE